MTHAPIAVSCGEPAGIGPELAIKAWDALKGSHPFFLIADPRHLPKSAPVQVISDPSEAAGVFNNALPVLAHPFDGALSHGIPDPRNAQGVIDVIARGVDIMLKGQASAICTLPIHKKALQDGANFAYPGHTEYLAALANVDQVVMMLASDQLRVVPTTIHIPLADVPDALTPQLIEDTIQITHRALIDQFGIKHPRITVAGLNPHAGEGGKMGHEDQTIIAPVIQNLVNQGMDIRGPLSADTMFHPSARAGYDVAICMYHDQALIPIKTLDFDRGVNITLGLPFIRTSPDHGTAFDIAGQNKANPSSTIEAIKLAAELGATS